MRRLFQTAAFTAATFAFAGPAFAVTDIQWWHAMSGDLGQKLEKIANDFNASQKDFKIVPVFKGTYAEAMTGAVAAFRAHQQPAIVQVFEVGTATMMAAKGAVYPVYELMKDENVALRSEPRTCRLMTGYYSDTQGEHAVVPVQLVDA